MTKIRLAKAAAKAAELSNAEAAACIEAIIEAITLALSKGGKVELRGLGTFYVQTVKEKKTGVAGVIPPHGRAAFRPSQRLRDAAWDAVKDGRKEKALQGEFQ